MKIRKDEAFQSPNKMLNSKINVQKKDGKEKVKHKPAIPPGDLRKVSASGVLNSWWYSAWPPAQRLVQHFPLLV